MVQSHVLDQIKKAALGKGRVSFISGKFNVLHPGHLRLFRYARETTDYLIVGVFGDGHVGGLLLPEEVRQESVLSTSWVDAAFILDDSPEVVISILRPDVVVKGKEYEGKFNPEAEILENYGGLLQFVSGDTRFSSLALLQAELGLSEGVVKHSSGYMARRDISTQRLRQLVESFKTVRVLVLGDLIVDHYTDCDPVGLSSEDTTVVVTPIFTQRFVGGAGIVAAHAGSLANTSHFLSVCGDDDAGRYAKEQMSRAVTGIDIAIDESRPTTVKTRYRSGGKSLLRVNDFRDHELDVQKQNDVIQITAGLISQVDLVIFSDFSYGFFSRAMIKELSQLINKAGVMMVADSQSSSQIGDISKFTDMSLVTPTEREARLATRNKHGGLVAVVEELQELTHAENVILTLGAEGVFVHTRSNVSDWEDDRLPALNTTPVDVGGAGDAFLVVAALGMSVGANIWEAAYLGSIAAGCQVGRIGNVPLQKAELFAGLHA